MAYDPKDSTVKIMGRLRRLVESLTRTIPIGFRRLSISLEAVIAKLREPYRTMVLAAQCLGLRVNEITALKWENLEVEDRQLLVQRSVVKGRVDEAKAEYSHDHVPIHESLLEVLLAWAKDCPPNHEQTDYSTEIQKRLLKPIGIKLGAGPIGWHMFRHTYRSWLDETGAPMKVQQELMRRFRRL